MLTPLAGCGGGVDASLLATAVSNTEAAGGAEVAFEAKLHLPGADQPMVMTGSGFEDAKAQRATLTVEMPGMGEMEVIGDGLTMYMRADMLAAGLGGKEWMKMDLERTGSSLGINMGGIGQIGQGTSEQLRMLKTVSDGVSDEGRETVRGIETTHYSATIDMSRVPDGERLIELTGQSEIPVGVWVDDNERVRRMHWEQVFREDDVEVQAELTAEYVRFGVPVEIDVPDQDDVVDATELAVQQLEQDAP
jgi:hypothetical protein